MKLEDGFLDLKLNDAISAFRTEHRTEDLQVDEELVKLGYTNE